MTVINTNVKSLVAQASLAANNKNLSTAMERLSTGKRINSAADDAAGLAISNRMTSQVRGLNMAIRNANDGISLMQTAEGAMDESTSILQRMRELALQASNATYSASDRASIQDEVDQLTAELDRIATTTKFNGQAVLDGTYKGKQLQIGADAGISLALDIESVSASVLGQRSDGPATAAARAAVTLSGVVTNPADYQGVDFTVSVNGSTNAVSIPPATAVPVSAANISANFSGVDRSPATSFLMSDTSLTLASKDMSAAANRGFEIAVGDGSYTSVDITAAMAAYYGVSEAAVNDPTLDAASKSDDVSAADFVAIVQSAIDATGLFSGDNAVTVGVDSHGYVTMAAASGEAVSVRDGVLITDGASATTFVSSFVTSAEPVTTLDMTDNAKTEFEVDVNTTGSNTVVNLRTYLDDTNFVKTRSAVTAGELANVLNTAMLDAGFTGDDQVTFSIDDEGYLNVVVAGGLETIDFTEATLSDGSGNTGTFVADFFGASTGFDARLAAGVVDLDAAGINDVAYEFHNDDFNMSVVVNGKSAVTIDMSSYLKASVADLTEAKGVEIVAALQAAFDDHFSGEDAISVRLDGDGNIKFSMVAGTGTLQLKEVDADGDGTLGTFVDTYIDDSADITFNFYNDPTTAASYIADGGQQSYNATRDSAAIKTATAVFQYAFSEYEALAGNRVAAFIDNGAATVLTSANNTLSIELGDSGNSVDVTLLEGTYNTLDDLAAMINDRIRNSGAFSGENAVTAVVYDGVDQADTTAKVRYLSLENAAGKKIDISDAATTFAGFGGETDSFVDDTSILRELNIAPDITDYATHGRIAGGVDTTLGGGVVTIEVVDGLSTIQREVSIGVQDENTTFASFASQLVSAANTAFAGDGISFSGSSSSDGFSFALNQTGGKTLSLSGAMIEQAFGANVSAQGSDGDFRTLASMDDVVAEINEDLVGVAQASFDSATGSLTFTALAGDVGSTSTISLAGDRLASLNFGNSLSAVGTDGNAEAASIADISVATYEDALSALESIDNALSYVSQEMSKLGAIQNRLDHTVSNLTNIVTNTEASRSRIMDADYGAESANLARSQIIQQAATAMLAQANQSAQSVLSLLQ